MNAEAPTPDETRMTEVSCLFENLIESFYIGNNFTLFYASDRKLNNPGLDLSGYEKQRHIVFHFDQTQIDQMLEYRINGGSTDIPAGNTGDEMLSVGFTHRRPIFPHVIGDDLYLRITNGSRDKIIDRQKTIVDMQTGQIIRSFENRVEYVDDQAKKEAITKALMLRAYGLLTGVYRPEQVEYDPEPGIIYKYDLRGRQSGGTETHETKWTKPYLDFFEDMERRGILPPPPDDR